MKSLIKMLCVLCCMTAPWSAHAQIFVCKDGSGRTISSDRPIPECTNRAVRELGSSGLIRREIPAPLTAEEKRQKQLQDEKLKAATAIAEEQRKSDRAIMARYQNEADIDIARKRSIDLIQEQIRRGSASIALFEKQWKQAQVETESYKSKQAIPPPELHNRLEQAEQTIKQETKTIQEHEAEIAQINARYDQTLRRFRVLTGPVAAK
jgi:chromosome segregation ATPase